MREFAAKKAGDQIEHPDLTPAFNTYRKNPSVWDALMGEKHIFTTAPTSAVLGESCLFVFSMFGLN